MSLLEKKIESLLYISNKPLSIKKLAELTGTTPENIENSLSVLSDKYNTDTSGLRIMRNGNMLQFATSPDAKEVVEEFLKSETSGEITRPQLETLTIIAYLGPILKEEIEHIRGVNCTLILRNLMIRGLVESSSHGPEKQTKYSVTLDFLRFLGIDSVNQLPDFDKLSRHEHIETLLANNKSTDSESDIEQSENADTDNKSVVSE